MPGKLIKYGSTADAPGSYQLKGGLEGIAGPGRRVVTQLDAIDALTADNSPDGLAPLRSFTDLRYLSVRGLDGLNASDLGELPLHHLQIAAARDADLQFLDSGPYPSESVALGGLTAPILPDQLRLPTTLTGLYIEFIMDADGNCLLDDVLARIDWSRLGALERFSVASKSPGRLPRFEVSQLTRFPNLKRFAGSSVIAVHNGEPVLPPFPGQPRGLKEIVGFHALRQQLAFEREAEQLAAGDITARDQDAYELIGDRWSIDIAFADLEDGDDSVTENAAARRARSRLKATDAQLLARLDFDSESDSTLVTADAREDLETAVAFWGAPDTI